MRKRLAKGEADFFRIVIPGRECNERAMVRDCAPENPFLQAFRGLMDSGFALTRAPE
jgi:hypothetical protein